MEAIARTNPDVTCLFHRPSSVFGSTLPGIDAEG